MPLLRFLMFLTISGNLLLARSKPRNCNWIGFWYSFGTAGSGFRGNAVVRAVWLLMVGMSGQHSNLQRFGYQMRSNSLSNAFIISLRVAEWLNAAVLKTVGSHSHLIQINNLRCTVLHRDGMIWAAVVAFCATECATARILCNRISAEFSPKNRGGFQDGWLRSGSSLT